MLHDIAKHVIKHIRWYEYDAILIYLYKMSRNTTTIIVEDPDGEKHPYTSLKQCCRLRENFSYYYLKDRKLPHLYKGIYYIQRISMNQK